MIRKFSRPLLRFPVKWANAVTDWITNLCSDGSLTISNSANPTAGVPKISVNPAWLAAQIAGTASAARAQPPELKKTGNTALTEDEYAKDAAYWTLGYSYDGKSTPAASLTTPRTGLSFDIITRVTYSASKYYFHIRTVTLSPLGVISSISAENKVVGFYEGA